MSSLSRLIQKIPRRILKAPVSVGPPLNSTTRMRMPCSITVAKPSFRALGAIPEDAKAKAHHVKSRGGSTVGFRNPHPSWDMFGLSFPRMVSKMIWGQLTGSLKFPDTKPPTVGIIHPTFLPDRFASKDLRTTWLGHACHYVEFPSGLRVLFDPVMEDRCSPFTFMGPKRYTQRPCGIADLPFLDAVIISHSHYDHLSRPTVGEIQKHHPNAHFFVGMGLEKWFHSAGVQKVTEMDWWEDMDLTVHLPDGRPDSSASAAETSEGGTITARISCLPAQHTSSRYGLDRDKTLWCSWGVRSSSANRETPKSVYFGGDTGYRSVPDLPKDVDDYAEKYDNFARNPDFSKIGELRGPFDVGLIPIGAYEPRFMMSPMHSNPFDAVEIFKDTRCGKALAIHWGTWTLTVEPVLEPPRKLKEALRRQGIAETGVFDICDIGESRTF